MIETLVGDIFSINLSSNLTTGYSWRVSQILPPGIIAQVDSKYLAPNSSRLGAGGKEVWRFKALEVGKAFLSLEYVRAWEKNARPAQTASFRVIINKKHGSTLNNGEGGVHSSSTNIP